MGERGTHTGHAQQPECLRPQSRHVDKLDVACEQCLVDTSEGELSTEFQLFRVPVIKFSREPESHLRTCELVVVQQHLPKRCRFRRRQGFERQTHNTRRLTVEQARGHLSSNQHCLFAIRKATHGDGIDRDDTRHLSGAIVNIDLGFAGLSL